MHASLLSTKHEDWLPPLSVCLEHLPASISNAGGTSARTSMQLPVLGVSRGALQGQSVHTRGGLCRRCQELSNGALVPGVADLWGRDAPGDARRLVSPEQLRSQLARVREQRAVAVLLVDTLDASGSFLGKVRDLVGRNPVVLVGTKVRAQAGCCERIMGQRDESALHNRHSWDKVDLVTFQ